MTTTGRFLPREPAACGKRARATSPRFRFMAGSGLVVLPPPPLGDPFPHQSTDCRRKEAPACVYIRPCGRADNPYLFPRRALVRLPVREPAVAFRSIQSSWLLTIIL